MTTNLYERNFLKYKVIPDPSKSEFTPSGINPEFAATFNGDTIERAEMLKEVANERERAMNQEALLKAHQTFKSYPVAFGGSWSVNQVPDSVTIYRNGEQAKVIAVPIMFGTYDKDDVLDLCFVLEGQEYALHFDNNNGTRQMRPTAIHVPIDDNNEYSIGVSVKKLPWFD